MIDNVYNLQNSCLMMQLSQIMQKNQAAPAIPVNNAGALFQMMMLQVVQKMAASMDLFPPVMAPSMLLRTHEPTICVLRFVYIPFSPNKLLQTCTNSYFCLV